MKSTFRVNQREYDAIVGAKFVNSDDILRVKIRSNLVTLSCGCCIENEVTVTATLNQVKIVETYTDRNFYSQSALKHYLFKNKTIKSKFLRQ